MPPSFTGIGSCGDMRIGVVVHVSSGAGAEVGGGGLFHDLQPAKPIAVARQMHCKYLDDDTIRLRRDSDLLNPLLEVSTQADPDTCPFCPRNLSHRREQKGQVSGSAWVDTSKSGLSK